MSLPDYMLDPPEDPDPIPMWCRECHEILLEEDDCPFCGGDLVEYEQDGEPDFDDGPIIDRDCDYWNRIT